VIPRLHQEVEKVLPPTPAPASPPGGGKKTGG
jgi:hypothetical protein